jgi:hypothetical protein
MITTVMPHASMPKTDTCRSMSRWMLHLKKAPSALKAQPMAIMSSRAKSARAIGVVSHCCSSSRDAALTPDLRAEFGAILP